MSKYPSLFQSGTDWHTNACLNFSTDTAYGYTRGYLRAGEILCDHVESRGRDQDTLVFPIVFVFRHHLEIQLKSIIKEASLLLGEGEDYRDGHRLSTLWSDCEAKIEKVWAEQPQPDFFGAIKHFIGELEAVDSSSDAFRYWESSKKDKAGEKGKRTPHLQKITHINIRHFRECMDLITADLEGISMALSAYKDDLGRQ